MCGQGFLTGCRKSLPTYTTSVILGWMVKLTCDRQFVGIIGRTGNHTKCITVRNLEMQMLRKRAIRIWDMKGENHQTQVYKSLYFLILIMYPPHVVNYNIQNQTTNLYLQYWICWMVQQPLWNVPLLLLSYIITLLIYSYCLVSLLLHVWRLFFHMAVVSYSCHRSYCTLNLLLLFMKLSKLWYHLKQKASFLLYLFLSLSLPLSTKPLSCHLEASSQTATILQKVKVQLMYILTLPGPAFFHVSHGPGGGG